MMMLDSGIVRSAPFVAQHRELADRPHGQERRPRRLVAKIDDAALERRVVLVEGDERLLAERGQRMEVEPERHAGCYGADRDGG